MKNSLILHGTNGDHNENWFPWLHKQLEEKGYKVWTPDLPEADTPNIQRYNKFLLEENDWTFDQDSILIGHSSGAVAIIGLLQALPPGTKVDTCYLVGAFKNDLGWEALADLFKEPFDFELVKSKAKRFVFIHSNNDPYCPLDHADYLAEQLNGDLIVKEGQKHFSVGTFGEEYRKFPFLLELIEKNF
ncbi:MAG: RBBP9/YdeN family alpha/beta hydrolase [Patescibacteria group bacterium]